MRRNGGCGNVAGWREKIKTRGVAVWFVVGQERVMAERLCSGRIRLCLGMWPAAGGDG
jgi:hypothetical protein